MAKKNTYPFQRIIVWIFLIFIFTTELLFYAWCRVQSTRIGYEITQAANEHSRLTTLQKSLKIELARLKSPQRIAHIARQNLGLITPRSEQIIVIP
ncbi:MAG: cell division protein FtsL [Desulfobacterales bacterium]|nr:cell division protein FtsL [Desulfobacterales bacterium]